MIGGLLDGLYWRFIVGGFYVRIMKDEWDAMTRFLIEILAFVRADSTLLYPPRIAHVV